MSQSVQHIADAIQANLKEGRSHGRFDVSKLAQLSVLGSRYVTTEVNKPAMVEHALGWNKESQIELCWTGFSHLESNPDTCSELYKSAGTMYGVFGMGTIALRQDVFSLLGQESCGEHFHITLTDGEASIIRAALAAFADLFMLTEETLLFNMDKRSVPMKAGAHGVLFEVVVVRPVSQEVYAKIVKDKSLELVAATKYLEFIGSPIDSGCEVVDSGSVEPSSIVRH